MYQFLSPKHDYWPIYEHLKRFYPLGMLMDEAFNLASYPGYKELQLKVEENIHNKAAFTSRWVEFEAEIEAATGRTVKDTTYGQFPSFSAVLEMGTTTAGEWRVGRELFFAVSLVGPFYTVIGQDNMVATLGEHNVVRKTGFLTGSPHGHYEQAFKQVCAAIECRFAGYRFVPISVSKLELTGLYIYGSQKAQNPVFYGLFNDHVDILAPIMGDKSYKHSDWLRPDAPSGQWIVGPPAGGALARQDG